MAKADNRIIVGLECSACKRRNYTTTKNRRTSTGKLQFRKYCSFCRSHQTHKECKA